MTRCYQVKADFSSMAVSAKQSLFSMLKAHNLFLHDFKIQIKKVCS